MQVKTQSFREQIGKTVKAVKVKAPIEAYSYIRLHSQDGRMRISASSTNLQIETFINEIEPEDFTVAVNGTMLYNIISRAPGAYTTLTVADKVLRVTSGGMDVKLPLSDPSVMSLKPVDKKSVSIKVENLKDFVNGCQHALDTNGNENLYESFHLEVGKGLRLTALDGRRIAIRNELAEVEKDIVLLGQPLIEASRVVTGTTYIEVPEDNDSYIIIRGDSEICTVSALSLSFFDVDKILNTRSDIKNVIKANKADMIAALEVVKFVSEKMTVTLKDNGVVLNAVDSIGDATMFVYAATQGDVEIAVNTRYMYEALKSLPEDEVEIGIVDYRHPMFVYGYGNKQATEIIVPLAPVKKAA